MCTVLLPPGGNPIAVNKYITCFHTESMYTHQMLCCRITILTFTFLRNFKISNFNKEHMSSLKMIWIRSKHVGAFLSVLIWTFETNILLHIKVHQLVCEIQWIKMHGETVKFLDKFWKNNPIPNFTNIRPVGAQQFHAEGRTDMTKPIVAFRNRERA